MSDALEHRIEAHCDRTRQDFVNWVDWNVWNKSRRVELLAIDSILDMDCDTILDMMRDYMPDAHDELMNQWEKERE